LISNLNNLGDVICSTAALRLIRDNFPRARIGLMVKPEAAEAVRNHPLVDNLLVVSYRSGSLGEKLGDTVRRVRKAGYEVFLSLDRKLRTALVAWLAGIRRRVVPGSLHLGERPKWWLRLLFTEILPFPPDRFHSLVEMFEEPARLALGLTGKGAASLPPIPEAARARAAALLAPAGGRPVAGFSVRANFPLKNWLPERWAEVMDRLEDERNAFIYLTGAPEDRDYAERIIGLRKGGLTLNLAGQTTLLETAALMAASDLFLTLDTGAVHVAGNAGARNLVCLFTCTEPAGVLESARQARVASSGEGCSPCRKRLAECPEPACQRNLTVEMVMEAAR
jgi:ADP-heptose:LPS heptosyltransferase